MNCREAIHQVFDNGPGVLTTNEVVDKIAAMHPDYPWKRSTISAHLTGLSVNHPSSPHYPSVRQHAFLFSLGKGRYRLWDRNQDGVWVVDETGVHLEDSPNEEPAVEAGSDNGAAVSTALSLERDLEQCLVSNIELLEQGLRLYSEEGITGQQYDTGVVGRLDILATDTQGRYVVIELKAGQCDERACGQILRYMGWVKRELAEGQSVRGILVANDFDDRVKYAAEAMENVTLKSYEVQFRFTDV